MKKNIFFLAAVAVLAAACAGNPPAWWNPGNAYSSGTAAESSRSETSGRVEMSAPAQQEVYIPQEVDIAPLPDESYEEMILTPLQDEETENDSGESSAQSAPTETIFLPPPSVLE